MKEASQEELKEAAKVNDETAARLYEVIQNF